MLDDLIELSDPQFDFLESNKKHTGFVAGFGSGKSFIGTLKSLNKIINYGVPKTAYYLPTYGDIRDIAFDIFPEVAELLGYDYKLNKSDKEFTVIDNGVPLGKVIFRNMSEPETIVGYKVGYTLIDETDILPQVKMDKAFKKILARNRLIVEVTDEEIIRQWEDTGIEPNGTYLHRNRNKLCWINNVDVAGTPEGFKWFYDRFVTKFRVKTDKLIKASTYSNLENLPDDYIESMQDEYTPELLQAYVNGEFVNLTSGTVYSYFNRQRHHTNRTIQDNDVLHVGQDFNVGGCCGRVFVIDNGKPRQVDEYSAYDTYKIIDKLNEYNNKEIIIYPDASGDSDSTNASKSDLQLLRDAGFKINAPKKNPRVQNRVNAVNTMFYKDELLVNTDKCPKSTKAYEQQAYDKNGNPQKFDGADTIDDSNDAVGYFIHRKFGLVKTGIRKVNVTW